MILTSEPDTAVNAKINRLFDLRRLGEQCEQMLSNHRLLSEMKQLQGAIYALDKYFEKTWNLCQEEIDSCWSTILLSIQKILGTNQNLEDWVREIRDYQKLEEAIRKPTFSLEYNPLYYYKLKTCDVRLARNLISHYSTVSLTDESKYIQAWNLFDLVSEVCDDLDDLEEDIATFNGNWFLLCIGTIGLQATINAYSKLEVFLSEQVNKLNTRVSSRGPAVVPITWTSERLAYLHQMLLIRRTDVNIFGEMYAKSSLATVREIPPYQPPKRVILPESNSIMYETKYGVTF
jgi:hypothetical protein